MKKENVLPEISKNNVIFSFVNIAICASDKVIVALVPNEDMAIKVKKIFEEENPASDFFIAELTD